MMDKVYIVESGEANYGSDIAGVFTEKEEADRYAGKLVQDRHNPGDWTLNESGNCWVDRHDYISVTEYPVQRGGWEGCP